MFPESFRSADGLRLSCLVTAPSIAPPRARVIVLHGLGDHCRGLPYQYLTAALVERGFLACSFDWRGHGASAGARMYAEGWDTLRGDLHVFLQLVEREAPEVPLFMVGLSLGGLMALNYTLHHPGAVRGVVAAAPAVDASGVPMPVRVAIPLLARILPRMLINPGLDLTRISRDAEAVREYTADPLFQVRTTPRLAAAALAAMAETGAAAHRLRVPVLLLHGGEDTIVRPEGSAALLARLGSTDRSHHEYPGACHNLFLEEHRAEVFRDITSWMEERLD